MKEKDKIKSKEQSIEDILKEVQQLSDRANDLSNIQLDLFNGNLGDEDIDPTIDFSSISDSADPQKSHRLYYGVRRLLIDYLPKGIENKPLRQYIYDEKNLFLKEGLTVGADGRQAYIANFLEIAFKAVSNWVLSGANPYDIYIQFRDLNIERGYHNIASQNSNPEGFEEVE